MNSFVLNIYRFIDPLTYGDYPQVIRETAGNRLPKFTAQESKLVKGSYDFLGINYYTGNYASPLPPPPPNSLNISYSVDFQVNLTCKCPLYKYIYIFPF